MKKILSFLSLFAVLAVSAGIIFTACSSSSSSKSSPANPANSIVVTISPTGNPLVLASGSTTTFTATVKNNGVVVNSPAISWTPDPAGIGSFPPSSTSSTIVFTAAVTTGTINGTITADYNGNKTSIPIVVSNSTGSVAQGTSINITGAPAGTAANSAAINLTAVVMSGTAQLSPQPTSGFSWKLNGSALTSTGATASFTTPSSGVGTSSITVTYGTLTANVYIPYGTPAPEKLLIYSDAGLNKPAIADIMHWDGPGVGQPADSPGPSGSVSTMTEISGGGASIDSAKYQRITYNGVGWTEWAFVFYSVDTGGTKQDLTGFKTLVMWMRSATPGANTTIKFQRGTAALTSGTPGVTANWPALTSTWQEYRLDISGITDKTGIDSPVVICLSTGISAFSGSIDIDYIYFEK